MNLITNMPRKWLLIATAILIVAIPLTMYLIRHQQIFRSRATGENTTLSIIPQTQTANLASNQDVNLEVRLNPDNPSVNALEFTLSYDDKLDNPRFQPGSGLNFDRIPFRTFDTGARTFHFLGYNSGGTFPAGAANQTIGTFTFRPTAVGTSTINIRNVKLTVGSASDAVTSIGNPAAATIRIETPSPTPGPSNTPTPTPAPGQPSNVSITFTDIPSCLAVPLTADDQLSKVTVNWQVAPASNVFWVDISTDQTFAGNNFYHKRVPVTAGVTTFSTNLTGFNHMIISGDEGRFRLDPGQRYFIRIYNGQADADGNPIAGQGQLSVPRNFSRSLCPTPSPSPTLGPTSVPAACSNVVPEGLEDRNLRGAAGRKIFVASSVPAIVGLQVTRTPATAGIVDVRSSAAAGVPNITPERGTGPQSSEWFLNIPGANLPPGDKDYTITTRVSVNPDGSNPVTCPEIIIRVPELIACTYRSTRVFVKGPGDEAWVQNRPITINQQIRVAAFHNDGQDADPPNFPSDIKITVTEPGGAKRAINNVFDNRTDNDNNILFTPNRPGTWSFSAETKGMRRESGCFEDSATVVVNPLPVTTTRVRIAESKGAAEGSDPTLFVEVPYTASPLTVPYQFKNKAVGDHEIWVRFIGTGASGEETLSEALGPFPITIALPDPTFDVAGGGVSCDLGVDNSVRATLTGKNFGATQGRNGSVKSGAATLRVESWSDTQVKATLEQTASVGQSFPIILTRGEDGVATESATCTVATSQIQLGATFFCRQNLTQTLSNVAVTIAEGREGGNVAAETVTIGANGLISGLRTKLQQDRGYRIGIKAPGTLRRVVEFVANRGTTRLGNLDLPVGDIFPLTGDGKINSADYSQLLREWVVASAATGERKGDLNGDGRVNSFDWACMRPYINQSDDSEPEARPLTISVTPTPAGSFTVLSPIPSPTPSPAPTSGVIATPTPSGNPSPTPTITLTPTPRP